MYVLEWLLFFYFLKVLLPSPCRVPISRTPIHAKTLAEADNDKVNFIDLEIFIRKVIFKNFFLSLSLKLISLVLEGYLTMNIMGNAICKAGGKVQVLVKPQFFAVILVCK